MASTRWQSDMERLLQLYRKQQRLVAGLMSGTSLDGIDVALVRITGSGLGCRVEPVAFKTFGYDEALRQAILGVCRPDSSTAADICALNFRLGERFAETVLALCREAGVAAGELDLIGSHGQTIWHIPGHSTLQIGEPAVIAERTGVITVADFRVRDVAAGGQGAPLVPYTEYVLYRDAGKTRLLQNIGGIANVTVLPAGGGPEAVTAFDTGPGNMMIDYTVSRITGGRQAFDRDGHMAGNGQVNATMLRELLAHPYLKQQPPKSTGREVFGEPFAKALVDKYLAGGVGEYDIVSTLTWFTAASIAGSYRRFILPRYRVAEVIVSGGGSHNRVLMDLLRRQLPDMTVRTQEELGFSSDAKEALAFAILANEAVSGRANNLPAVTGARGPVVMGKISL